MRLSLPKRRMAVLLLMLGLAAWLAIFGDKTPAGTVSRTVGRQGALPSVGSSVDPSTHSTSQRQKSSVPVGIEALVPRERLARTDAYDLFATPAWSAREAKPVPLPVSPPPLAAPAPVEVVDTAPQFRVVGKRQEGLEWEIYLSRDDVNFIAKVGATLDASYRVESISPPSMVLMHLPSGKTHSLSIGEAR